MIPRVHQVCFLYCMTYMTISASYYLPIICTFKTKPCMIYRKIFIIYQKQVFYYCTAIWQSLIVTCFNTNTCYIAGTNQRKITDNTDVICQRPLILCHSHYLFEQFFIAQSNVLIKFQCGDCCIRVSCYFIPQQTLYYIILIGLIKDVTLFSIQTLLYPRLSLPVTQKSTSQYSYEVYQCLSSVSIFDSQLQHTDP